LDQVHDHALRPTQVVQRALDHLGRAADQRRIVQPDDVAGLEVAALEPGLEQALIERHGPLDALHAADAEQHCVLHGLDVVDELHLGVHDPDLRQAGVADEAVGPRHQADEDRRLLRDEQGGERQAHDDAQVLGPVAHQHGNRDGVHARPRGAAARR
jgi:hypothetical protein